MSKSGQRKKLVVDKRVQGSLLVKAGYYWALSIGVIGSLTLLGWVYVAPGLRILVQSPELLPAIMSGIGVAICASIIVLGVVLWDLSRESNRFAGPIYRLRCVMRDAAAGKRVEPIRFREEDHWHDLAEAFNDVLVQLEEARRQTTRKDAEREDEPELVSAGV